MRIAPPGWWRASQVVDVIRRSRFNAEEEEEERRKKNKYKNWTIQ